MPNKINVNTKNINYNKQVNKYKTVKPALGIGDLLSLKMYGISNNIIFNEFIINTYIIKWGRSNFDNSVKFLTSLINNLFNNPKITLTYEENFNLDRYYNNINTFYLYDYYKFSTINGNVNVSSYDDGICGKKYIIFHCKIRFDSCSDNFNNELSILDKFIDEFRTDYDIILFGERNIEQNTEVKMHNMISIYQNIIKLKK